MSKTINFTDAKVRQLPAFKKKPGTTTSTDEYSDQVVRGLKLDVNAKGGKFWSFTYTVNRRKRSIAIGDALAHTTKMARARALEFRAMVDQGIDPHLEKDRRRAMPTVREFVEGEYLPWARKNKLSAADDESRLRHHVLPIIGDLPLSAVRTADIETIIDKLLETRSKGTANRVLSVTSKAFKIAIERTYIPDNPCRFVRKQREAAFNPQLLTVEECQRLFVELDKARNIYAGSLIKLLFLTGARFSELRDRRWSDFDEDLETIFVEKPKNGESRHIQLSAPALAIIRNLPRDPDSPYMFPARAPNGKGGQVLKQWKPKPICDTRKTFDNALKRAGLPCMRHHDARHCFGFYYSNHAEDIYSLQRALGHKSIVMTQRYSKLKDKTVQKVASSVGDLLVPRTETNDTQSPGTP